MWLKIAETLKNSYFSIIRVFYKEEFIMQKKIENRPRVTFLDAE